MGSLFSGITLPGRPDLENTRRLDLLPIPMIRTMQRVGIAVDVPYLLEFGSELAREMAELQTDISSYMPAERLAQFMARADALEAEDKEINAASHPQIRALLFGMLGVGRGRQLKLTDTGLVSTGKRQLEVCREDHPVVPKVLAYRERSKLKSSFTDTLPAHARLHPRGNCCPVCELTHDVDSTRIHGEIPTTRAETGRLSMREPNLEQLPVRTALGSRIRYAFIAPPGKRLVSVDFSQIELRDLAHLANAQSMISVYEADGDIHDNTARKVFNLPPDVKPDKIKHRLASKRTNFSIQNGTSPKGLFAQLVMDYGSSDIPVPDWLTEDWCKWFIERWLEEYPEAAQYFDLQHYRARRYGFVWDPWGRVRRVPERASCHSYIRSAGMRQAQNMPITASSAAQLKLVMGELEPHLLEWRERGVHAWPLLPIHDQIISEVDEEYAELIGESKVQLFENVMNDRETGERLWRVPIRADCEIMERWAKQ